MKLSNKLQTLLNDLRDKIQRRQWHVRCAGCRWEVRNLDHERFALARARAHNTNAHGTPFMTSRMKIWHSRA